VTLANATHAPCAVGSFYEVPCMPVAKQARVYWMPSDLWVPVLGPKHADAEHLEFPWEHYHIDWRFISQPQYESACANMLGVPHSKVLTNDTGKFNHLFGKPLPQAPQVPSSNAGLSGRTP
jgi:hypothetical protein